MKRFLLYVPPIVLALGAGFAFGRWHESKPQTKEEVLYYEDPMHPAYRSNKPGIAPDCGMDLVPVYAKDVRATALPAKSLPDEVQLDLAKRQLYGINLAQVERTSEQPVLSVFGRVAVDDTRVYRLNISTAGFVKDTRDDAIGDHVKKDQRLATIYSSELIYAVTGFISGNERIPGTGMRENAGAPSTASSQNRADYLRNLGMSEAQINELRATKKIPEDIYIESPADGIILSRNISRGLRFEKNAEFYRIADLSRVWIMTEVYGKDIQDFRAGVAARIVVPATGEIFIAHVSNALPEVDAATRTLKVRLEVDNPGFKLRPDMSVNVELTAPRSTGLSIPSEALLNSGLSKRVFVQTPDGSFKARQVQTGWQSSDRVQIVKGLQEGETVVVSGTFLVDSESRLQMASNAGNGKGSSSYAGSDTHLH